MHVPLQTGRLDMGPKGEGSAQSPLPSAVLLSHCKCLKRQATGCPVWDVLGSFTAWHSKVGSAGTTNHPCSPDGTPRDVLEQSKGGGGSGTQQFVYQKWQGGIAPPSLCLSAVLMHPWGHPITSIVALWHTEPPLSKAQTLCCLQGHLPLKEHLRKSHVTPSCILHV